MESNRDSFEKALIECKIIRYENMFKNVVKSYLKNENEQLRITDVSNQRELLIAAFERLDRTLLTMIEIGDYEKVVDEILSY